MKPKRQGEYCPVTDLKHTTQIIARYCIPESHQALFGDTKQGILRNIIKFCNKKSPTDLLTAIEKFNITMKTVREEVASFKPSIDYDGITHILEQAYLRTIAPNAHKLNKTKGFSNTVYGEVKYSLVNEFIKNTGLKKGQLFLDMVLICGWSPSSWLIS